MSSTIASTLLNGLDDWLRKVESEDARKPNALNDIAVCGLFPPMTLMVQIIRTDIEGWKEVAEFVKRKSSSYRSPAANGCLTLLGEIAKLFITAG